MKQNVKTLLHNIFMRLIILKHRYKRYLNKNQWANKIIHQDILSFRQGPLSRGLAIGIFCAFLPMPFQMVPAFFICWIGFANLPIAIVCVWISNPLTYAPIFYLAYLVGVLFEEEDVVDVDFTQFADAFSDIFETLFDFDGSSPAMSTATAASGDINAFLLAIFITTLRGSVVLGIIGGALGYWAGYPISRRLQKYIDAKRKVRTRKSSH